jgi:hypothetical protein
MAKRKTYQEMTRAEFDKVPLRKNWSKEVDCDGIVILPQRRMHDSGYRCMDFVAVKKGFPVCRLSGCSDVIHFDGIGGRGLHGRIGEVIKGIPIDWNIDCLPKSGLLHIFTHGYKIRAGAALSSFEIFALRG